MVELRVPPHVVEVTVNHIGGTRSGVAGNYNRSELMALVNDRPIRASLPAIKLMKSDPAAVEAQREEIIIRYSKIFGAS